MKKYVSFVLLLLLILFVTGCNDDTKSDKDKKDEDVVSKKDVSVESLYKEYFYEYYDEVYAVLLEDITNDKQLDMIVVEEKKDENAYVLKVFTVLDKEVEEIYSKVGAGFHAGGFINIWLYEEDGKKYFLDASDKMWQGYGECYFDIYSIDNNGELKKLVSDKVKGDPVDDSQFSAYKKRLRKYIDKSIDIIVTSEANGIVKSDEFVPEIVFKDVLDTDDNSEENKVVAVGNKVGNTSSNRVNDGYFTSQGDVIYYANVDGSKIYSMKKGTTKVFNVYQGKGRVSDLNVIGEYIYFIENINATLSIKKVKLGEGSVKELKNDVSSAALYVDNKYVYYAIEVTEDKSEIYRMDLTGNNSELLATSEYYFFTVNDNYLYYCGDDDNYYKMNLDTKEKVSTKIIPYKGIFTDKGVYQNEQYGDTGVWDRPIDHYYVIKATDSKETILENTNTADSLAVIDDKLYYSRECPDDNDRDCFYRSDLDGGNELLLIEGENPDLIYDVGDDYIYYFEFYNDFRLKRIPKDITSTLEDGYEVDWMFPY